MRRLRPYELFLYDFFFLSVPCRSVIDGKSVIIFACGRRPLPFPSPRGVHDNRLKIYFLHARHNCVGNTIVIRNPRTVYNYIHLPEISNSFPGRTLTFDAWRRPRLFRTSQCTIISDSAGGRALTDRN